ncbi:MAG: DUF5518 domain-containing protein [Methanoregula sp.]
MDTEVKTFWISVITGVIVMLVFAVVFVNVFHLIPIVNPFVGGLAAGLIAGRGALYGARAGLAAGMAGGVIVSLDYLFGTGFFMGVSIPVAALTGILLVIVAIMYFGILAFIGGAVGGQVRH